MIIWGVFGVCKKALMSRGKVCGWTSKGFTICVTCEEGDIEKATLEKLSRLFKSEIKEIQINEIKNLGKSNEL